MYFFGLKLQAKGYDRDVGKALLCFFITKVVNFSFLYSNYCKKASGYTENDILTIHLIPNAYLNPLFPVW